MPASNLSGAGRYSRVIPDWQPQSPPASRDRLERGGRNSMSGRPAIFFPAPPVSLAEPCLSLPRRFGAADNWIWLAEPV